MNDEFCQKERGGSGFLEQEMLEQSLSFSIFFFNLALKCSVKKNFHSKKVENRKNAHNIKKHLRTFKTSYHFSAKLTSSRYLLDILIFFTSRCNIYHFSHVIIMFSEVFKMWKSGKKLIAHPSSGRLEHSLAPFYLKMSTDKQQQ